MEKALETFKVEDLTVEISIDKLPLNPRDEGCPLGTMLYASNRYILGDRKADGLEIARVLDDPGVISLPVYAYIHSGVALNTTGFACRWDSGLCGVIFVDRRDVLDQWKRKRMSKKLTNIIRHVLEMEVLEFSMYLNGEVFCYSITNQNGEVLDSCSGLYGLQYAVEHARIEARRLSDLAGQENNA